MFEKRYKLIFALVNPIVISKKLTMTLLLKEVVKLDNFCVVIVKGGTLNCFYTSFESFILTFSYSLSLQLWGP